jgi:hypothetical protein
MRRCRWGPLFLRLREPVRPQTLLLEALPQPWVLVPQLQALVLALHRSW